MRAKALLLLAVFLGAVTSFPSLDALLHHGREADSFGNFTHVEPAGGCPSHAGHCTLGRTAPGSGADCPQAGAVHPETLAGVTGERVPAPPTLAAPRGAIPQPRAPPAPLV